jgi:hypothetical protein
MASGWPNRVAPTKGKSARPAKPRTFSTAKLDDSPVRRCVHIDLLLGNAAELALMEKTLEFPVEYTRVDWLR